MKKILEKMVSLRKQEVEKLTAKYKEIDTQFRNATELKDVQDLTSEMMSLRDEISAKEKEIADVENELKDYEERNQGFNPLASYGMKTPSNKVDNVDELSTEEYRSAFKNYVQTGELSEPLQLRNNKTMEVVHYRADTPNVLKDVGVLLPNTLVQQIMKEVEEVHGQLYSKVKKTDIPGGVEYPIGSFGATFHRKGETDGATGRQNAGKVTGSIKFTYHIGEIRLSQTLLSKTISVPVFEAELAKVIVEAYVKAMDNEILNGSGSGEMEGILTELAKESSRIKSTNIIEFTAEEMKDWKSWHTKLFAKIPLSMRKMAAEFVMTANTFESNILTLHDDDNRPVGKETFNPVNGAETASFKGKLITFVEDGFGIENFNDAENGKVFALYWVPEKAYCVNTNMQFAVRKYYDEEKDEFVTKALVINDGKILDPKYLYILKKKVSA